MRPSHAQLVALVALLLLGCVVPAARADFDAGHDAVCEGAASIRFSGSNLQAIAQHAWGAGAALTPSLPPTRAFGYDVPACRLFRADAGVHRRTIGYNTPRLVGEWGASYCTDALAHRTPHLGGELACGTERPPTTAELATDDEGENVVAGPDDDDAELQTVPVAQASLAIVARLPDGCQLADPRARQLSAVRLEGAFAGSPGYDQWGELFPGKIDATPGSGRSDTDCRATHVNRVLPGEDDWYWTATLLPYLRAASARPGGSGTTWRDAACGNPTETAYACDSPFPQQAGSPISIYGFDYPYDPCGGALPEDNCVEPPQVISPFTSAMTGAGGLAYTDLATARAAGYGWTNAGGVPTPDDRTLWLRVQRLSDGAYVSPARSDDQAGTRGARCEHVEYAGQPSDTDGSWHDVNASATTVGYPLCLFSYVTAWRTPKSMVFLPDAQGAARTVKDYLGYVVGLLAPGKAQGRLNARDELGLPPDVLAKARAGVASLTY